MLELKLCKRQFHESIHKFHNEYEQKIAHQAIENYESEKKDGRLRTLSKLSDLA